MLKDIKRNLACVLIPHTGSSVYREHCNLINLEGDQYDDIDLEWNIPDSRSFELDQEYKVDLIDTDQYKSKRLSLYHPSHYDDDRGVVGDYEWDMVQAYNNPSYFHQHQRAKALSGSFERWTIVRNPYERLVNQYFDTVAYMRSFQWDRKVKVGWRPLQGNMSSSDFWNMENNKWTWTGFERIVQNKDIRTFATFIDWKSRPRPNQWNEDYNIKYLDYDVGQVRVSKYSAEKTKHYLLDKDQTFFTHDDDGNDLIDTYLRYETIKQDWNRFAKRNKYPKDIFDMKVNWTIPAIYSGKHYSHFYDDQTKELADQFCLRDCKNHGYEFEWK